MIKRTILTALFLATLAQAQAVFTPPVAPTPGVPGKLVATAGTGAAGIVCTLTGNAVPATTIAVACALGSTTIQPFTIPLPSGSAMVAFSFQFNSGPNSTSVIVSLTPQSSGIALQATVNGGTAVTGTF